MKLSDIAALLEGPLCQDEDVAAICIDSRKLKPKDLFIAIKGQQFDGHDFIEEAERKGALAVICERPNPDVSFLQFKVKDCLKALVDLASYHRQTLRCPIIALTGSNGKTTVKEMIAAILPKPSHATLGNLNNHIGVPLSVLRLNESHRFAVFELGANHLGEIAHTAAIVKPQVALINNIAPAHIGEFGSIEGVARAKGEIYEALTPSGIAIVNEDDDYAHFWDKGLKNKEILRFSLTKPVDAYAQNIVYNREGCATFSLILSAGEARIALPIPGEHSVYNALAAAACCHALGIGLDDISQGLNHFQGVAGRLTFLKGKNQSVVIDDTYNANLHSTLSAIAVLAKRQGLRVLVLGDMGELGEWTKPHHEEVGQAAAALGIDLLLTYGIHSFHTSQAFGRLAKHYANQEDLAQDLLTKLDANTTVLVKGSRSAQMEKIVRKLVG